MKTARLSRDLHLFCVPATSFPEGIGDAFQKLEKAAENAAGRTFFGVSHMGHDGRIVYKAAVPERHPGEGQQAGFESNVLKQGIYLTEAIDDWRRDETVIGRTFQAMLADERLDPKGCCVEWYRNDKDVVCLVRLDVPEEGFTGDTLPIG